MEMPAGRDGAQRIPGRRRLSADSFDDRTIAYRIAARDVFDGLRALIGQLSGLLILAQARLCRDLSDLPEIAIARERWRRVLEDFGALRAPDGRAGECERLRQAATHIDAALAIIGRLRRAPGAEGVDDAAGHLTAAYRLLQSVCNHDLGMTMVDMSGACCACGGAFERSGQ